MKWNELSVFKYVTADDMAVLAEVIDQRNRSLMEEFVSAYAKLDSARQGALGYCMALLLASYGGYKSPYQKYYRDFLLCKESLNIKYPFAFCGWAGINNDIGPAYIINKEAFTGENNGLFYTDDDIRDERDGAERLAGWIAGESSGLWDVHVEKLSNLQTMEGPEEGGCWGIVFFLDEQAVRDEVIINGKPKMKEESGGYLFVLPKAGEFNAILGERVEDSCFILSKDMYCMK